METQILVMMVVMVVDVRYNDEGDYGDHDAGEGGGAYVRYNDEGDYGDHDAGDGGEDD